MGFIHRVISTFVLAGLLAACGGGGGAEPDLSGWWLGESRPSDGTGSWETFGLVRSAEVDGSWWVEGTEFARSDTTLSAVVKADEAGIDRQEYELTIVGADELLGSMVTYRAYGSEAEDLRFTRTAAPTGTFTLVGIVDDRPVDLSSTCAYARHRVDGPSWVMIDIRHCEAMVPGFSFGWQESGPIVPGTYDFGPPDPYVEEPWDLSGVDVWVGEHHESPVGGTVTFTAVGPGRIAGSFDLTMGAEWPAEPETVSGTFDVVHRVFFTPVE